MAEAAIGSGCYSRRCEKNYLQLTTARTRPRGQGNRRALVWCGQKPTTGATSTAAWINARAAGRRRINAARGETEVRRWV